MIAPAAPTPFIGRRPLLDRLESLLRKGRPILLLAPTGAGKSTLIARLSENFPLLYAPRCDCLGNFIGDLEPQAGLAGGDLKMAARVHRLARHLPKLGRPLVVDHVARVPPRVAHLIRGLLGAMPVWFAARSALPMELGHVWPYLFAFQRIDLPPFSPGETRAFLAAAPFRGNRDELLAASARLHRLTAGHPATLAALVDELGCRAYDLKTMEGLHVLALHARITRVQTHLPAAVRPGGPQGATTAP